MNTKEQYKLACSLLRELNELENAYYPELPERMRTIEQVEAELKALPDEIVQAAEKTTWPPRRISKFDDLRDWLFWRRSIDAQEEDYLGVRF